MPPAESEEGEGEDGEGEEGGEVGPEDGGVLPFKGEGVGAVGEVPVGDGALEGFGADDLGAEQGNERGEEDEEGSGGGIGHPAPGEGQQG